MSEPTKSIEMALYQAILESRVPRTEPRQYFYASSLGFCPRKQIAERMLIPPTNPPDRRSQCKMWTGTVMGKAIQESLEKVGFLDPTWREKSFTLENTTGRVDGYCPELNAIVEIKTTDDAAIKTYRDVPEHYLYQGFWYCLASGIPNLLLFQFGKNQGLMRHRVYHLESEWEKKVRHAMLASESYWQDYLRTKELPPHDHRWSWEDRYCPYVVTEEGLVAEELAEESA